MKKRFLSVLSLAALIITGCSCAEVEKETHLHTFSDEFTTDDDYHWREATCGHDVKESYGVHDYGEVQTGSGNSKYQVCKICDYAKIIEPAHFHTYSSIYLNNENFHWRPATCGHDTVEDLGEHDFEERVDEIEETIWGICKVCQYEKKLGYTVSHVHTYSNKYKYDDEYHWQPAICHPGEKQNYGEHVFGDIKLDGVGLPYRICSTCRYKKYEDLEDNKFLNVTEFADDVEIHTAIQKEFLSYNESTYDIMPNSLYPDGSKNISDPVFTRIMWKYYRHNSGITYSISISQNEDMSNGFEIIGTNEQEIDVYNLFLGYNYYRITATDQDGESENSIVYRLHVNEISPRNLYVGTRMTNCRDTGGRVISTGGVIKQGMLYRTCGNGYNQDGKRIDDEGKNILLNQLKVKTEISLHNNESYNFNLEGTNVYNTLMDYAQISPSSKNTFSRNTESLKNVFSILANEDSYPIYCHCRNGVDRTGLVSILLQGILGVPLNDIYQDYLFTNFGKIGVKRNIGTGDSEDIASYIEDIKKMPGHNFNEQCYNTLLTIGVSKETIKKIHNILIDGDKPNYENDQIVMDDMDVSLFAAGNFSTYPKPGLVENSYPSKYCTLYNDEIFKADFNISQKRNRTAYIYVGHSEYSDVKKIDESISAEIDGLKIVIPSITFKEAGMGNCNSRKNFYFVKLGDLGNLGIGKHNLKIYGVANNLILGNVAVI